MNRANRPRMSRVNGSSYASKLMGRAGDGSTLNLDFTAMGGTLDPRITFSRADATALATFINSLGYVETVATAQAPRFTFSETSIGTPRGLLLEAPATNNCRNSSNPSLWPAILASGATITDGTGLAPNNITTPKQVALASGSAYAYQQSPPALAAATYTFSVWMKAASSQQVGLRINRQLNGANSSMIVASVTTSWQRFSVSLVSTATDVIEIGFEQRNNGGVLAGPNVAATFLMWGAQLEAGPVPSSNIETTTIAVTRAVDTAIIAAGSNFSSWYTGGTTGTFVTEWCRCSPTTTQRTVIATSDVSNQHFHQYIAATTSRLRLADKVPAFIETANASVDNSINKGAFSYSGSVQSLCLNGGTVVPGTLTFTTAPTWLSIGGPSTNGTSITDTAVVLNNAIRKIKYFPTRLSDGQIQGLSTL